jgi:hypothetical protein
MLDRPTPFPEVNAILQELLTSVQAVLGEHLVGMYLEGSLTSGDFDPDSDIDFVVVTDEEISASLFSTLQAMHRRIAGLDSVWAVQLEGSYLSQQALRRYDPANDLHPNIERGDGELLKWVAHGEGWIIHRRILRERGIILFGPDPKTLIDPVSPDGLRRVMLPILNGWAAPIREHPEKIAGRGYQSYVVLSLCRILFTLQWGDLASKPKAVRWARQALDEKWEGLIERAWIGRHHPQLPAEADDIAQTLDFISYALRRARHVDALK